MTNATCTSPGPMSNCFTKFVMKSSCLWKLADPSLEDESRIKTMSVGCPPQSDGV